MSLDHRERESTHEHVRAWEYENAAECYRRGGELDDEAYERLTENLRRDPDVKEVDIEGFIDVVTIYLLERDNEKDLSALREIMQERGWERFRNRVDGELATLRLVQRIRKKVGKASPHDDEGRSRDIMEALNRFRSAGAYHRMRLVFEMVRYELDGSFAEYRLSGVLESYRDFLLQIATQQRVDRSA